MMKILKEIIPIQKWSKLRWAVVLSGVLILSVALFRLISQAVTPVDANAELIELLGDDYQAVYIVPVIATPRASMTPTIEATRAAASPNGPLPQAEIAQDTPEPPAPPTRLVIEAIELDAPVEEVGSRQITVRDVVYEQWLVPDKFAAGWNPRSGFPGEQGNMVLFGHNNAHGKVFANLYRLEVGDKIVVYAGNRSFTYVVSDSMKLKEKDVTIAQMVENAAWIGETDDERLTLVTCWPPYQDTYRLIVVARPESPLDIPDEP
jgi:sortase A